ncbi:Cell Division Cycle Protein 27-like [Manis pentadactyla]|nr:Cell Division Cycle Protein 27-like [Manis pentadactyla]
MWAVCLMDPFRTARMADFKTPNNGNLMSCPMPALPSELLRASPTLLPKAGYLLLEFSGQVWYSGHCVHSGSDAGLLGDHPAFIETALPSSSFREVRPLSWTPFESMGTGMEEEDCLSDVTSEFLDLEHLIPRTNDWTSPSHLQAHRGQVTVLLLGDGDPLGGVGIPGSGDGWESSSAPGVLGVPGPPIKAACGGQPRHSTGLRTHPLWEQGRGPVPSGTALGLDTPDMVPSGIAQLSS